MKDIHTSKDEWSYPATNTKSRKKAKRIRQKAKRKQVKKLIDKELNNIL
jgi:hypothetical protein